MEKISFSVEEELIEEVHDQLSYGDNRSAWLRDAIELKLELMNAMNDLDQNLSREEQREFIIEAVREASKKE